MPRIDLAGAEVHPCSDRAGQAVDACVNLVRYLCSSRQLRLALAFLQPSAGCFEPNQAVGLGVYWHLCAQIIAAIPASMSEKDSLTVIKS